MKKFFLWAVGFLAIFVVFAVVVRAEEGIREGKWTMTMVTKMEGLPPEISDMMNQMGAKAANNPALAGTEAHTSWNAQGMTTTVTQCVTNQNAIPEMKMPPGCEQTSHREGNTFKFHATCNGKDFQMNQTGQVTYTRDTMQGLVKSHQTANGMNMDSTIQITGQYIGPCK